MFDRVLNTGDNTEKIWAHRFFLCEADLPKACKMTGETGDAARVRGETPKIF